MNDSKRPWTQRRLHFVGVGGAGMSGYARAAHALGANVSGSDSASSVHSERLREEGVLEARIGHDEANVPDGRDVEIVYSSAVPADNPERLAARQRGLADRPRAELLAELSALRRTIAVAGAHGKTTTASMIVHLLREGGVDPGWLVGSSVGPGLANSHWSEGDWLVVEADESDRSMLSLDVEIALLTNVELDHHATFGSLAELREAFREFLAHARTAVVIWDRPELLELLEPVASSSHVAIVPYDVAAPELEPGGSRFSWRGADVRITVPGAHNARNAAGALEVARLVGLTDSARTTIAGFTGAARRFQRLGVTASGAVVIDDYAHHPTEVAATLNAARTLGPMRLVAVFQPHLYSRTALLADEFATALAIADVVVVLDVYPARERAEDHPGISGETLVRSTIAHAEGREVLWRAGFDEAQKALGELLEDGDLCVMMGAGDVDALGRRLVGDDGL
ncbi:MAG TPA: UDP-N-acetylmuramate--L-alanine ligase [Solirubrobacteraceae bacterium]|jgi:UDP-N-acetylmuramate--alanine ligase|nr:UDP-N-acetylmuramate--L-alanine ligase [Solirubrobacteraceae bacterium]